MKEKSCAASLTQSFPGFLSFFTSSWFPVRNRERNDKSVRRKKENEKKEFKKDLDLKTGAVKRAKEKNEWPTTTTTKSMNE